MTMLEATETALRNNSVLPAEFSDIILMMKLQCTYQELMDTPAEIIDYLRVLMQAEAGLARERAAKAGRG